jgi:hypothetical protein
MLMAASGGASQKRQIEKHRDEKNKRRKIKIRV